MANREELGIIRGARAGDAVCQLALGKLYLFGGASLPLSVPTALHWLNRAALQDQEEAWLLIGNHIPYEHAQRCLPGVLSWYERAYDAGVQQAGLVLAQLVLQPSRFARYVPFIQQGPAGAGIRRARRLAGSAMDAGAPVRRPAAPAGADGGQPGCTARAAARRPASTVAR
jgi:TPR repeat protein